METQMLNTDPSNNAVASPYRQKLTKEKVKEIREKHQKGIKQIRLAEEYGVTRANISLIIKNKTWAGS